MIIYLCTVLMFFVGIILCYIERIKICNCKNERIKKVVNLVSNEKLYDYLVNIMVTFLGVTIAIIFTDYNTEQQEREQTIEFLNDVLLTELGTKSQFILTAIIEMDKEPVEEKRSFEPEKVFETMKIYPLSPVLSLEILLEDSPYKYTISRYTYSALIDCRMNFAVQKNRMENTTNIEEMKKHLDVMLITFNQACKVVEIELKYQNRKIKENDVYIMIDKLYDELNENEEVMSIG